EDAVKTALDSNLSVRSAYMEVRANKALRGASLDLPKTDLEAEYGQFNSYNKDNSVTVSQSFAFPSVYINKRKLAQANTARSEYSFEVSRLDVSNQVKQVYWHYVFMAEKLKLLSYQDSLFQGFLRAAELKAKAGETNRLEMITARSQSMEIRNKRLQVIADLDILSKKLALLLNSEKVIPSEEGLRKISYDGSADSNRIENNPSLGLAFQKAEIARVEKKLERSQAMPDLSLGWFSQTITGTQEVNGVARDFGRDYRFNGVQAGISIPLWIAPFTARSKAAAIRENAARTDAEYVRKNITGSLSTLYEELGKYSSAVEYYEKQAVPEAETIIEQAQLSYRAGAMDYTDYMLMLNRAIDIRMNYLEAINNYNQTIISIDYVTGKIL
ncbi:MAG TPA: TolC family protein, partial [Bacteroidales bacterium]|nr:TolC family protein [Bacteroidales bacterium]